MDFFITDILRSIFFRIDNVVYWAIEKVYLLLIEIASITLFNNDVLQEFADKVYALVGVFMLFKISFSVLSYIVNPDEFVDKNKGIGKIISNVIISLALIIVVPAIFNFAMEVQQIVLKDDILPRLFSTSESNIFISSQDPSDGSQMAVLTFSAFYDPDAHYENIHEMFKQDVNERNAEGTDYAVEYNFLLSTAVGVVVVLLLVSFCFDVAIRSVKLGFLQILSPIPIISRIDPKKGSEVFNKWVKVCFSTYLDLFIRLIAIFFAVYIIKAMAASMFVDSVTGEAADPSRLVKAFIVMGALMFAKQLPNLVKDLTGLDLGKGSFTLNPFKKLSQVPLVGAAATGFTAMAGGAISGGWAGNQAGHWARGALQGAVGAASGLKGKVSLMGGDGKGPGFLATAFAGSQAGHKAITGKDYAIFNPLKYDMFGNGEQEVERLKKSKNVLYNWQAGLDADLQDLYKAYQAIPSPESAANDNERQQREAQREAIMSKIKANRAQHAKYTKEIGTLDDQIGDIKRIYTFDESKQGDVKKILAKTESYERNRSNSSSSGGSSTPPPMPSSSGGTSSSSSGGSSSSSSGGSSSSSSGSSSSSSSSSSPRPRSSETNSAPRTNTNRSYGPSSSPDATAMQQRVEQSANYHEAPTMEQHIREYGNQTEFWNRPDVVEAVNANERRFDENNNS